MYTSRYAVSTLVLQIRPHSPKLDAYIQFFGYRQSRQGQHEKTFNRLYGSCGSFLSTIHATVSCAIYTEAVVSRLGRGRLQRTERFYRPPRFNCREISRSISRRLMCSRLSCFLREAPMPISSLTSPRSTPTFNGRMWSPFCRAATKRWTSDLWSNSFLSPIGSCWIWAGL